MGKAQRLFNGSATHTLYGRITPTPEQMDFLQEQWNALATYLCERLSGWGYPVSTLLQGSYRCGTLIKPLHTGESYDVDVGVYFSWDTMSCQASPTAKQLRAWVQSELLQYVDHAGEKVEVVDPPKERCSRAIYRKQFHIDTPTYHLDSASDQRRLACLSGKWEESDPKPLHKWFRDVVDPEYRDQLRRLVRYLKAWAAIEFQDETSARPSSVLLTVLAAEAFSEMWAERFWGVADDTALGLVVGKLYQRLANSRKVPNPVDAQEDLNRIPPEAWEAFLTRLAALNDAAQLAESAEDEASAALAWEGAFQFLMPLPETDAVEIVDEASSRALMQVPDVVVLVYDRPGGTLLATHRNEVQSVPKDHWLVFRIENPQLVPRFADISWTVRNDQGEADRVGDLGHVRRGIGMVTVEERTAYLGKHSMDCVIRLHGSVFAVRRVPVFIEHGQRRAVAQPQRAYLKLQSRKGRRRG